jgi:hypothetical protein
VWCTCAALAIISAGVGQLLGSAAVDEFVRAFSSAKQGKGGKSTATVKSSDGIKAEQSAGPHADTEQPAPTPHAVLDSIVPETCPGQPELARRLLHAVGACDTATSAVEAIADSAVKEDVSGDGMVAMHAPQPGAPRHGVTYSKKRRVQAGAVGPVSESDDERAGSDEEGLRRGLKEEGDDAVKEHLRGRPRYGNYATQALCFGFSFGKRWCRVACHSAPHQC